VRPAHILRRAGQNEPAFKKGGFTTAGNASIISDGAAAVVVMSREKAEALGCTVMATIGAQASAMPST
jgi:acetyl-CoA C-acetyltransferase